MRRSVAVFFVLALMLGGWPAAASATICYQNKGTSMDQTGDWLATFGRNAKEKQRILAKRRLDRFRACCQKNLDSGPRGKIR